ncbi:MAG: hypothetical protein JO189_18365 [Deltaproteobacteria bacterium]|nr:hypothetical protein [Deltaproteobacteria bacterium]
MPFPRAQAVGPQAAHAKLSPMQKDWDIGLEVISIVGDADTIIAERVEHFRNKTNAVEPFDLPVVGVFEIADGKIKAWRDYWDRHRSIDCISWNLGRDYPQISLIIHIGILKRANSWQLLLCSHRREPSSHVLGPL